MKKLIKPLIIFGSIAVTATIGFLIYKKVKKGTEEAEEETPKGQPPPRTTGGITPGEGKKGAAVKVGGGRGGGIKMGGTRGGEAQAGRGFDGWES